MYTNLTSITIENSDNEDHEAIYEPGYRLAEFLLSFMNIYYY